MPRAPVRMDCAFGWALPQHAWRDPQEITRYVAANEDRLSPLSKREALKNVNCGL